jgi:Peptidase inhibitor family I36
VSFQIGSAKVVVGSLAAATAFLFVVAVPVSASGTDPLPAAVLEAFPVGLPAGALIVGADTVASATGSIVIDLTASASTDGVCPDGWVCLWEDANWTGPRIRFSACDVTGDGVCAVDAKWAYDVDGGGTVRCMQAGAENGWVGTTDNDKASSIKIFKNAAAC